MKRFASPALTEIINELAMEQGAPEELVSILMWIVAQGRLSACASVALKIAKDDKYETRTRCTAIQAIGDIGDSTHLQNLRALLDSEKEWPPDLAGVFIRAVFPSYLAVSELLKLLERLPYMPINVTTALDSVLEYEIPVESTADTREELLNALVEFVFVSSDGAQQHSPFSKRSWLFDCISALLRETLNDNFDVGSASSKVLDTLLLYDHIEPHEEWAWHGYEEVRKAVAELPDVRRYLFWKRIESKRAELGRCPINDFEAGVLSSQLFSLNSNDVNWLSNDSLHRPEVQERLLAFRVLAGITQSKQEDQVSENLLSDLSAKDKDLAKRYARMCNPPYWSPNRRGERNRDWRLRDPPKIYA